MSDKHTPGRLTLELVESDSGIIKHLCPIDTDGLSLLTLVEHNGVKFAAVYYDDDARRLVACWNAFEGLTTEQVESMINVPAFFFKQIELMAQRDELLEALKDLMSGIFDGPDESDAARLIANARAAIAKVEGGAA